MSCECYVRCGVVALALVVCPLSAAHRAAADPLSYEAINGWRVVADLKHESCTATNELADLSFRFTLATDEFLVTFSDPFWILPRNVVYPAEVGIDAKWKEPVELRTGDTATSVTFSLSPEGFNELAHGGAKLWVRSSGDRVERSLKGSDDPLSSLFQCALKFRDRNPFE